MSDNAVNIIRATLEHLNDASSLFDSYRAFYGQPRAPKSGLRFLIERLRQEDSVIYLARKDGIGAGFMQLYPSFSSISLKRLWILNDLFVAPECRHQGVATALLSRARQHALETDAKGLVLSTETDNEPAQRLYERMGWKREQDFCLYYLHV